MKYNYQIIIEYLGTNFAGWQIQKNGKSIQGEIEKALSKTLKSRVKIIGSGRTDAGVNAWGQSANFFCNKKITNFFKILTTINFYLNKKPISVIKIKKKNARFHARHSAKKREYEYIISNRIAKLSIDKNRSWLVKKKLNILKMKKAAKFFIGNHNFSTFRSSSCTARSPVRTISKANVKKKNGKVIITFASRSFLQKQVRSMVGCLKYVGENIWEPNKIKFLLKAKKRKFCAPPAPADGLYLKKVFY